MHACRAAGEATGGAQSSQAIEMVEGSYSNTTNNGDSRSGANPFGFDSFGNSLAGPGQQQPPRSQQQTPKLSLVGLSSTFKGFKVYPWQRSLLSSAYLVPGFFPMHMSAMPQASNEKSPPG